jgi:lipoprotein-anchoring transpeptidase ErfK/SrfK
MKGTAWNRSRSRRGFGVLGALVLLIALVGSPFLATTASAAPVPAATDLVSQQQAWSAPRTVYIPQTGHTVDGVFLDFWRSAGGAAAYGNPISSEYDRNGRLVQYYEYARFEYVPEGINGSVVALGNIGYDLRPSNVMRLTNGVESSAIEEFARITRAWLPVSAELAAQPATASFVYVPETGHTVANGFKSLWEYIGQGYLGNPISEEYIVGDTTYQVFERGQLAWTAEKGAWMVPLGASLADRQAAPVAPVDQGSVPVYDEALFIPPGPYVDPNGPAVWFDINLSSQYLTFYQGDREVISSYMSSGRPGFETPTGTFYINSKYVSHDMEGTAGGETWFVEDVPWSMYFTNNGHAIHGTYWHNNFGNVMSHGCVNLPLDVAQFVFDNSPIGTRVYIHY